MNQLMKNLTGMNTLSDQVIAMDLLVSAKSGIQMYAVACTESGTPEVKATLERHLFEAIDMHERVTRYMMSKGYYHPYNIAEQIQLDQTTAQTALNIPS